MYIKKTYIGTLNGITGIWCGFKPENAKIDDIKYILYPEDGYLLQHKETHLIYGSVSLEDGRKRGDYNEIPESEQPIEE